MKQKQKHFVIIIVSTIIIATGLGVWASISYQDYVKFRDHPALLRPVAFEKLQKAYLNYSANTQESCPWTNTDCSEGLLSTSDRLFIAQAYDLIKPQYNGKIFIGLLKGNSIHLHASDIQNDDWNWELGTCDSNDTNRRMYINAKTGLVRGIDTYVYCGGVE